MKPTDIKDLLLNLGHFAGGESAADVQGMSMTCKPVRKAVQSYQSFMAQDFDRLSLQHHGRIGIADGEIGPATNGVFDVPRCGYPDILPASATGTGSWPAGCHDDWPDDHSFTVNVDKSGMPSFLGARDDPNSIFEQAWLLVRASYADMGIVFHREDGNGNANTTVTFVPGRGWIGLASVPNNPRCGQRYFAKFDNRYSPSQLLYQWARLLAHEFGHNMSMGHSRGGTMNPSIISGVYGPTEWRGDVSEPLLTRYFGGVPVDLGPDGPDDPDPPPTPTGKIDFKGELRAYNEAGDFISAYELVPTKPPFIP